MINKKKKKQYYFVEHHIHILNEIGCDQRQRFYKPIIPSVKLQVSNYSSYVIICINLKFFLNFNHGVNV